MDVATDRRCIARAAPSGFTLVEVLLVVVIMMISVGVAMPAFIGSFRGQRLRVSARAIVMTSRYARSVAVLEQAQVSLLFDVAKDDLEVVVLKDAGERSGFLEHRDERRTAEAAGAGKSAESNPFSVASRLRRPMEEDVQIDAVTTAKEQEHDGIYWVNYYPNGMCDEFSVRLRDDRQKTVLIKVDPISGRASVEAGG